METCEIEQMIEDNTRLVYYIINKYFPASINDEDIVQLGKIGLWKACKTYDSEKSKFATYATRCIRNEIMMEFRRRKKLANLMVVASIDDYIDNTDETITFGDMIADPVDRFAESESSDLYSKVIRRLSERDRKIVDMMVEGLSQKKNRPGDGSQSELHLSYLEKDKESNKETTYVIICWYSSVGRAADL